MAHLIGRSFPPAVFEAPKHALVPVILEPQAHWSCLPVVCTQVTHHPSRSHKRADCFLHLSDDECGDVRALLPGPLFT